MVMSQPWAAAAMPTFDASSNTYTFTVRPGLKWSDGTPIDANTFAYSINRSLSPCTGSAVTYYLYPIKDAQAFSTETCGSDGTTIKGKIQSLIGDSITVPDSQTLVITARRSGSLLPAGTLTYPTGVCPATAADPAVRRQGLDQPSDRRRRLRRQPLQGEDAGITRAISTWSATPASGERQPKLREVDFKIYKTADSEYADYLDGKLDQGVAPPAQYKASKQRSDFHEGPFLPIGYYQPNWAKAPFNNLGVRQAFDLALNKTVLANQVNQGTVHRHQPYRASGQVRLQSESDRPGRHSGV